MTDFTQRLRNRARRFSHGVPPGVVSPFIPDNVFQAHVSLFDFFAAFCVRRNVLFSGTQAAWGASYVQQRGAAASVTAIVPNARARQFGKRRFETTNVTFADAPSGTYDVVIGDEQASLAPNGKLLLHGAPSPALRSRFASVRRFVQYSETHVDLRSPVATLDPASLRIRELRDGERLPEHLVAEITLATNDPKFTDLRLHLGCGPVALPGWVNVDNLPYEAVDFMWDLVRGTPFRDARFVFAEHFIEHLDYRDARSFVAQCREVLRDDGVLRMSTPNLDWVWLTSYHPEHWTTDDEALRDCFVTNRAFRGWGHQFLYNVQTLRALLRNAGFADVAQLSYSKSERPELNGLEHHTPYPDTPELPHVIVVEATGRRTGAIQVEGADSMAEYERDVAVR